MKEERRKDRKRQMAAKPLVQKNDAPLQPAGETVVSYEETAAKPPPGKQIHRRRPLPPVPEKGAKQNSEDQKSDETNEDGP